MRTKYTLSTDSWTAISTANQSGTACVKERKWSGRVIVCQSNSGVSALSKDVGALVFLEEPGCPGILLDADDTSTIFYAIALDDGAEIIADMV